MTTIGGIDLGDLPDFLFFFADARNDANWQGASKGYVGDVAVDGIQADQRTSGTVPYAGTIFTNDTTLGAWQDIVDDNPTQATGVTNQTVLIDDLENDLISAFQQINALTPTVGFESVSSTSLDGLNTQDGIDQVFVINITSGLNFSSKINITGDAGDVFILRWDTDGDPTNGYQGQVKPQSGGAIVPQGDLAPTNFINVGGDINASGGGSNPAPPYPQGPRFDDGQGALIDGGDDFDGGGFFTGYWLTTGEADNLDPDTGLYFGETSSLSNGIFVGGWYSITTKFSMTSGTSGVYVSPNPATTAEADIDVEKEVSADGGTTFVDADTPPGPDIIQTTDPVFRYTVSNTGNETLTNITLTDSVLGPIAIPQTTLNPGESFQVIVTGTWAADQQTNTAIVEGEDPAGDPVTDTDEANYVGVTAAIDVEKFVSDDGVIFEDADIAPGPFIEENIDPVFKFIVTNTGTVTIDNITLVDSVLGPITIPTTTLDPGESFEVIVTGTWAAGQQTNTATVEGTDPDDNIVTDDDQVFYFGTTDPAVEIQKLVSVDGGETFVVADTSPGPTLPPGVDPVFRYIVTNIGGTQLIDVEITDDVLGPIVIFPDPLNPGDQQSIDSPDVT